MPDFYETHDGVSVALAGGLNLPLMADSGVESALKNLAGREWVTKFGRNNQTTIISVLQSIDAQLAAGINVTIVT